MQLRETLRKPVGDDTDELIKDAAERRIESEARERAIAFYNDQIDLWKEANQSIRTELERKTFWTKAAQLLLLGAATVVAVLAILAIWTDTRSVP